MNKSLFLLLVILAGTVGAGIADVVFSDVVPIRPYSSVFATSSRQVPLLENIISSPLYTILALVVAIVVLSIAATIVVIGSSSSAGLISMRTTISAFGALFGVGLAIGLTLGFLGLVRALKKSGNSI